MAVFLVAVLAVAAVLSPVLLERLCQQPGAQQPDPAGAADRHRLEPAPGAAAVARGRLAGDLPDRAAAARALPSPQLLAPMASMLAAREAQSRTDQARFTLSATAMRSLLDGIASRLDESRELSRYMTGLLIFLGLLGTFWGLLKTVGAVSDVIGVDVGRLRRSQRAVRAAQVGPGEAARRHGHGVLRLDVRPVRRAGAGLPRPHRRARRRIVSSTSSRSGWPA